LSNAGQCCFIEGWTLKVSTMNKLKAFEMWVYRRRSQTFINGHAAEEEEEEK